MYFCGTKDYQVVTGKYFCRIVVEGDKHSLVWNVNCISFYHFYLIMVSFFIRTEDELANYATLYDSNVSLDLYHKLVWIYEPFVL